MQVDRYYLEINSLKSLNQTDSPNQDLTLEKVNPPNIELNKFFYKNIGKNHRWVDRLAWDNLKWISYLENKNVNTYTLKLNNDLVGYFETIQDLSTKSIEIGYFGILDDYIGNKFGSYLLSEAIKICSLSEIVNFAFLGNVTDDILMLVPISKPAKSTSMSSGIFPASHFNSIFLLTMFKTPPFFRPLH